MGYKSVDKYVDDVDSHRLYTFFDRIIPPRGAYAALEVMVCRGRLHAGSVRCW